MRFVYSNHPAYLLVVTCRFLLCFTKTKVLDREMYHTQTYVKRWDNLHTTNKRRLRKFRRQHRLQLNAVTRIQYFEIEFCGGTANKNKILRDKNSQVNSGTAVHVRLWGTQANERS